jgi:hypothetical protein
MISVRWSTAANGSTAGLRTALVLLLHVAVAVRPTIGSEATEQPPDFTGFEQSLEAADDAGAMKIGNTMFSQLQQEYRANAGFGALEAKHKAAEFLAAQMQQQLRKAAGVKLSTVAADVFATSAPASTPTAAPVAPARRFFETGAKVFSRPVNVADLTAHHRSFLAKYYNLNLRVLTSSVAKAGQALAIADPDFNGTYDYVLVLPLLHASKDHPVSIEVLPRWMRTPEQIHRLSESCLLTFEQPFFAMALARDAARDQNQPFDALEFYRRASQECRPSHPHVAADCIRRAMELVPENDDDGQMALHFEVIQIWLDAGSYELAASEARTAFESYAAQADAGKAIWLYYYALSRSSSADQILLGIDDALNDKRCRPYRVRLMYVKWWALRRQRDEGARVAAVEHELLTQYGNDPIVAPILLSQATDLLASQAYDEARDRLDQLIERFPSTRAANQARRMVERLVGVARTK